MFDMEKLCGSVLRTLNYGRNLKDVQCSWVFYRSRSSTVNAADVLDSQSSLEAEYEKAKPFNEIPGPKGMPFIGTLLQYRKGTNDGFFYDKQIPIIIVLKIVCALNWQFVKMERSDKKF